MPEPATSTTPGTAAAHRASKRVSKHGVARPPATARCQRTIALGRTRVRYHAGAALTLRRGRCVSNCSGRGARRASKACIRAGRRVGGVRVLGAPDTVARDRWVQLVSGRTLDKRRARRAAACLVVPVRASTRARALSGGLGGRARQAGTVARVPNAGLVCATGARLASATVRVVSSNALALVDRRGSDG